MTGCALQSSMVDIEDSSERLRKHQIQLQRRIERLEGVQKKPSRILKNQQLLSADLVSQLDVIAADVREYSGLVTESQHRVSKLEANVDSRSFQMKDITSRLEVLRHRISVLEKQGGLLTERSGSLRGPLKPSDRGKQFFAPRDAFNLAYNDYVSGDYNVAILAFDAFINQYPDSRLIPQALYWTGESYYGRASYQAAIGSFQRLITGHPKSEKVSKAMLKLGFSYLELKNEEEGRHFLEQVIMQFPNSNEAALARDTLSSLKP